MGWEFAMNRIGTGGHQACGMVLQKKKQLPLAFTCGGFYLFRRLFKKWQGTQRLFGQPLFGANSGLKLTVLANLTCSYYLTH